MPSARAAAPPYPPARSVTRTSAPAVAAVKAAAVPAAPKPTTTTSAVSSQLVISPPSHGVTSFGSIIPSSGRSRADGIGQLLGPGEDRIEHGLGQHSGEGVLLARVVRAQQGPTVGEGMLGQMPEPRPWLEHESTCNVLAA